MTERELFTVELGIFRLQVARFMEREILFSQL